MKHVVWLSIVTLSASVVLGLTAPQLAPVQARAGSLQRVDDPPPDPTECPFCGGNPELHRTRVQALLRLTARVFERAMP